MIKKRMRKDYFRHYYSEHKEELLGKQSKIRRAYGIKPRGHHVYKSGDPLDKTMKKTKGVFILTF